MKQIIESFKTIDDWLKDCTVLTIKDLKNIIANKTELIAYRTLYLSKFIGQGALPYQFEMIIACIQVMSGKWDQVIVTPAHDHGADVICYNAYEALFIQAKSGRKVPGTACQEAINCARLHMKEPEIKGKKITVAVAYDYKMGKNPVRNDTDERWMKEAKKASFAYKKLATDVTLELHTLID